MPAGMTETAPEITPQIVADHGLDPAEYEAVVASLGRTPNLLELGIFSVMWSEHCSYKSSRRHLKKLPTEAPWVICGPGENAGVIDIGVDGEGRGLAAIFKMESHNHPSFIEPYQGAATGVGGILRDVFTMGARPVANLNALRFGDPAAPRMKHLIKGVVAGIGGYGNCVGVPTVGGETNFHPAYNGNILVNAMTVGVARTDKIFYSAAAGVGNSVVYVGSKTGRDGIHGATMASAEFTEGDEDKRPTVQVGDPFTEKLLIEACLELMASDAIVAIQDMGAAGLTSLERRDGVEGRRRARARHGDRAVPRGGHDALRDDAVGEPGADAHGPEARARGVRRSDLPQVGIGLRRYRPRHRHRAPGPEVAGRDGRRHPAGAARRQGAELRPARARPRRLPRLGRRQAADRRAGIDRPRRRPAEADGLPRHRVEALDLGAVRPHGRGRHGPASRRRRGGGAGARDAEGAGDDDRLHAALLLRRPLSRAASRRWRRRGAT